jgi:tRNA ligase
MVLYCQTLRLASLCLVFRPVFSVVLQAPFRPVRRLACSSTMAQQDHHETAELVKALESAKGNRGCGKRGGFSCRKSTFHVAGSDDISVDSWRFQDWDYKRDDLPTYARGLFTTKTKDNKPEIVIRGYDKFFNVGEVNETQWRNVETRTMGPYELSVKENGCIIFMSGLEDGTLLVCSKHSTGVRTDVNLSHAQAGERWAEKHLASVGKTRKELAQELRRMNATAVAELCDDTFEEHVLEYPPEMAGLYLHGINFNLPEFATLSGPEVHEFADTWGFKKAQYVVIQHIDEVKTFLDKCAETGSWEGRDTEGFVIRCKMREKDRQPYRDWFFKYKFEEPYLMYRQWREATKSVIMGKPPRYKKHKQITEEYLLYARRQLAKNPKLGKEYNQNHGIIAMRDGFLAEIGQKGSDIIAQERLDDSEEVDGEVRSNVVLVPVASIGCGKTTVARALVRLFEFGHVQNDDIEGQKGRPKKFALAITNALAQQKAVIADRNNHQRRERKQIFDDVSSIVRDARFVALHYVHDPKDRMLSEIRKVTRKRVLDRGDNHQTIHADTKGHEEIAHIMEGFIQRFEGVDTHNEPDSNFDEVIDLDVTASSLENLETVVTHLYNAYPKLLGEKMPSQQDMEDAIAWAMENTVTLKHDLSFMTSNRRKKHPNTGEPEKPTDQELTTDQVLKKVEYFSIPASTTVINSTLASLFNKASAEEAQMYNQLKQSRRLQPDFHATLIHRASSSSEPGIWSNYIDQYAQALTRMKKENKQKEPTLGPARIRLERLVWDDRVMAFVVRILPSEGHQGTNGDASWPSANATPHITVGTKSPDIKPKESNDLLRRWLEGDESQGKIWEREVPDIKILEGTVRAVMQRR